MSLRRFGQVSVMHHGSVQNACMLEALPDDLQADWGKQGRLCKRQSLRTLPGILSTALAHLLPAARCKAHVASNAVHA